MLAYAANRPRIAARQSSPNALLFVICAHIVLVAAVMSAKMGLPSRIFEPPTTIVSVPLPKPPPAPVPPTSTKRQAVPSTQPDRQPQVAPTVVKPEVSASTGNSEGPALIGGDGAGTMALPLPQPVPVSTPAQPLTAPADLRPPYPESKLVAGEEAALTLRLTVDEHGRVIAVDPIGRADPVFLAAARKHLIARWRYKPAMEDGRPVSTFVVITLRFKLDG